MPVMSLSAIESLLEKKIGLSVDAIGPDTVAKAVHTRMEDCGLADTDAYLSFLDTSKEELEELIEAVVVPETWFFRNKESFDFLGSYAFRKWLPRHRRDVLRLLSIASSTGEEPYSMAMALLEAGLNSGHFHIDAVDISGKSLNRAKLGIYLKASFRGKHLSFRERYFKKTGEGYEINSLVRNTVRFIKGNLLDARLLADAAKYDVIFCRNLMIYLTSSARRLAMDVVDKLLNNTGLLFVGHAERPIVVDAGLEWIREPGVFAFRRTEHQPEQKTPVRIQKRTMLEKRNHKAVSLPRPRSPGPPPDSPPIPSGIDQTTYPLKDWRQAKTDDIKLLDRARSLADQGALDEALASCERCLEEDAFHVQAHFLKGLIHQARGDQSAAEDCFNKVAYLDPNHHEALSYLTFIAKDRGDLERAARLQKRVQRINRKEAES
jgi:chemotaxis protein methyltransferase WspC